MRTAWAFEKVEKLSYKLDILKTPIDLTAYSHTYQQMFGN